MRHQALPLSPAAHTAEVVHPPLTALFALRRVQLAKSIAIPSSHGRISKNHGPLPPMGDAIGSVSSARRQEVTEEGQGAD